MNKALQYCTLMVFTLGFAIQASTQPMNSRMDANSLTGALSKIFEKYQTARNISDPDRLIQAARRVHGPEVAQQIQQIYQSDRHMFVMARARALKATPVKANGKSVVVSGLSASGAAAAMIASNAGYRVTGFEARAEYTRNIQWTGRQSIIDSLALIDQGLGDRFLKQIARPISSGSDLINNVKQETLIVQSPRRGNPAMVPGTASEMLDGGTVMLLQTKEFEKFMLGELRRNPAIDIRLKSTMTAEKLSDGLSIAGIGRPDLVVIAEGTGSKTRTALGIGHAATSPSRTQIAGELLLERYGAMSFNKENVSYANGEVGSLLTSAISKVNSGRNWTVTDVADDAVLEPAGLVKGTHEYAAAKQSLVNEYYYGALAKVLGRPLSEIRSMSVAGPIEKTMPTTFQLQQNMSKTAVFAENAVAIGDTVGNAHWNVGGGMHIALISHIRRLSNLMFDLEFGRNRGAALAEYDQNVLADSAEWGRRGITDFYPNKDAAAVRKNYDLSLAEWAQTKALNVTPASLLAERLHGTPSVVISCGKIF